MGLDIYINRKQHFGGFGEKKVKATIVETSEKGEKTETIIEPDNYGFVEVKTEVGYWRKANQIYKWFKDNGECSDEYATHIYVSAENLYDLLDTCKKVKESVSFVKDKVETCWGSTTMDAGKKVFRVSPIVDDNNRTTDLVMTGEVEIGEIKKGDLFVLDPTRKEWHECESIEKGEKGYHVSYKAWEIGNVIADTSMAEKLLPTQEGFFFGSTDYTEWYVEQIEDTIEILEQIIAEHKAKIASGVHSFNLSYEVIASY